MKKNNNKKLQAFLMITALVAISFSYQYFKNIQIEELHKMAQEDKKAQQAGPQRTVAKATQASRKIASTPSQSIITKIQNRKIVGQIHTDQDFPISNSISKDWKELAVKKLQNMIHDKTQLEIREVKPVIFVKHNIGKYAEHVKVILKKESGLTSSYDAYIDTQSGNIIRTWNRTKFEIKPKVSLQAQGNEFFTEPLKKKTSSSL